VPVIYIFNGIKVYIYHHDHNPAHIHVIRNNCEAKFTLAPFECYYARGFSRRDLTRIHKKLQDRVHELWEYWYEYQEEESR
jgi:hypothetical protein